MEYVESVGLWRLPQAAGRQLWPTILETANAMGRWLPRKSMGGL